MVPQMKQAKMAKAIPINIGEVVYRASENLEIENFVLSKRIANVL